MEKRAVQVSHELWKQIMTQGYTSGGVRCVEGLPEDARLVESFAREEQFIIGDDGRVEMRSDPVFVFESDKWTTPTPERTVVNAVRETIPVFHPVFRTAECRTCKHWDKIRKHLYKTEYEAECNKGVNDVPVPETFGCVEYEPRETDD